jgi:hypothetical protein
MSQFKVYEDGMQVNGQTILSIVDGIGAFSLLAENCFRDVGLPNPKNIVPTSDYPQQNWLDAFRLISERVGSHTLFQIGKKIPENAKFPPEIKTIEDALSSIDIAYHMNHRNRKGETLFDPKRIPERIMLEGIGHYGYTKIPEQNKALMVCENPYPCDFDWGIITTMVKRFNQSAIVIHDDSQPCRKRAGKSCTYIVTWHN